jgi:hypothetical protein
VDVSRVSEESGREGLEALRRAVVGRRRVWVEEDRGWVAESDVIAARRCSRLANVTFKKWRMDGDPPEEASGMRWSGNRTTTH